MWIILPKSNRMKLLQGQPNKQSPMHIRLSFLIRSVLEIYQTALLFQRTGNLSRKNNDMPITRLAKDIN